ncbi:competence protein ComEC [Palleronia aestuarii]|uniref:Competence protein ComEC n=1 Tax=Palleronia aestuarii TaxID=568105 RepID=A0A2W7NCN6_9RHOB|nr:ComEC/Rec2 family competence protein [Palleronia aestuarii]PZX17740.1 competence protein ComEC [Palleronia aestuarii]
MRDAAVARLSVWLALDAQRGALMPWIPVCLAIGIGLYFSLPTEPSAGVWWALGLATAAGIAGAIAGLWRWPPYLALLLVMIGLGLAGIRNASVSAPVLGWRYYGPVEGRVIEIDRSSSEMPRLTLDRVVLERTPPSETPERVRVSLHGDQSWLDPKPGMTILVTAFLGPPEGPVEPGGFDFQRMAWFERLGAVGYARTPALLLEPAGAALPVERMRMAISAYVQEILPGEPGAFAAAITTGDRSGMGQETIEALRISNLAHLLAISGLHMGLLTGFVFMALRGGLSLVPALALNRPIKSYAAAGALCAGAFYLSLSGGSVATQRAFIMAAVVLGAVILNRRALTLRAVAVAAIVVLVLRPEALTGPGFQMSFAATVALVAVFRAMRHQGPRRLPNWTRPALSVVISSAVAGAATAPFAAAHFNQIGQYGLLANVISVPLMGLVVMPAAVVSALLAPFGLAWVGLEIMAPAIRWILGVAEFVSGLDGALTRVPSPGASVLPLIALGAIFVILWQGRGRLVGIAPVALAFGLWAGVERPDILIAPSGGLIGVMGPDGRALSKSRGDGFAATAWLENDGDDPVQERAAERPGLDGPTGEKFTRIGDLEVIVLSGRGVAERARAACTHGRVVVVREGWADADCTLLDEDSLSRTGALALYDRTSGVSVVTAREVAGDRPWNAHLPRRREAPDLRGPRTLASRWKGVREVRSFSP